MWTPSFVAIEPILEVWRKRTPRRYLWTRLKRKRMKWRRCFLVAYSDIYYVVHSEWRPWSKKIFSFAPFQWHAPYRLLYFSKCGKPSQSFSWTFTNDEYHCLEIFNFGLKCAHFNRTDYKGLFTLLFLCTFLLRIRCKVDAIVVVWGTGNHNFNCESETNTHSERQRNRNQKALTITNINTP